MFKKYNFGKFLCNIFIIALCLPLNAQENITQPEASTEVEKEEPSLKNTVPENKSSIVVNSGFFSNGNVTYAKSTTKIKLSASDPISSVQKIEYKIDNAAEYITYTAPIQIREEGAHQIHYRALDLVGNIEFENVVTVIIDTTSPVISTLLSKPLINVNDKNFVSVKDNTKLSMVAIDEYSGVKGIEYSINGGEYETYTVPIILNTPGDKNILIRSVDNLGNTSEVYKMNISVDFNIPTCNIALENQIIESEGKTYSVKNNKFVITAADAESSIDSIYFKLDDSESFEQYISPIILTTEGKHIIVAKSVDKAGNESELVTKEVIVDIEAPQSSLEFISE